MRIITCLIVLMVSVSPVFAGMIDISGRAGIYSPSVPNASPSIMYGIGADIRVIENVYARAAIETTTYSVNNVQTTMTPITADIIYRQTLAGMLSPYVGAGLGYYTSTTGPVTTQTTGYQAQAGVSFSLGGFSSGVEFRYMVPDSSRPDATSTSYNAYASGAFTQSIRF